MRYVLGSNQIKQKMITVYGDKTLTLAPRILHVHQVCAFSTIFLKVICYFSDIFRDEVIAHKTFHRYTVRAKRGTAQGLRDGQQGVAPHSAGASLRRYNEAALHQVCIVLYIQVHSIPRCLAQN